MKNILLIKILFIFLFSGCTGGSGKSSAVTEVKKRNITQKVTISGKIYPRKTLSLIAPYNGFVKKIFVELGQDVKKGDPLLTVSESLNWEDNAFPIKAPFSGKVVQINKKEGEYVSTNDQQKQILRMDDITSLFIEADVPEVDYLKIKMDQEVSIRVVAINERVYNGKVTGVFLASKAAQQTWQKNQVAEYPINIEILDEDEQLKPGMSAIIDVVSGKKADTLSLPHDYVFSEGSDYFVTLENGKKVKVTVGVIDDFFIEVFGLKEGDKVQRVDFYKDVNELGHSG